MPLLLLCGMGFFAFFTAVGTIAYTVILFAALTGGGGFSVNGVPTDRAGFFAQAWPTLIAFPPLLALFGSIVYGLWRERLWSRQAMMGFWAAIVLVSIAAQFMQPDDTATFVASLSMTGVMWAVAWWYCYRKRSVVAYFSAIKSRRAPTSLTSGYAPAADGA
jgi:hypothetical protein